MTNVNEAPVVTSGATANFVENATGTVYTATATDVDSGTTLSYTIGGTDSALFNINASTGAVTFKAAPDYEAPSDSGANNVYDITVTASDGSLTATQAVAITVTNLNDNAPIFTSGATGTVAENAATSTVIYTAATTDADNLAARTYTVSGTDAGLVDITSAGVVTLKASADYESKTSYSFNVIANDGANTATQAVVVSVTNTYEAALITSAATASFSENGTGAAYSTASFVDASKTLTYSALKGVDAALFNISVSGVVTFKAVPNFEAPTDVGADNVYYITINATDGVNAVSKAVAITVTDVNEAPAMASGLMTTSVFEVADAAASTSTAYTLLVGQTAQGNLTVAGDHDRYKVTLESGKTYSFAMLGTGVSNIIDPYLKLYNSSGNQVTTIVDPRFKTAV